MTSFGGAEFALSVRSIPEEAIDAHEFLGPPCILDSIRRGKPLPMSDYPLYSRVLEGVCVSSTGFTAQKKAQVEAIVRFMGGTFSLELTSLTHYLVASEVGSEKYFVACKRSIPVVRSDWLLACWKECAFVAPSVRRELIFSFFFFFFFSTEPPCLPYSCVCV